MRRARAIIATVAAALLLTACFLLPGKFASTLDVRRDGGFDFTYKGEIVLLNVPGMGGHLVPTVDDPAAPCFGPSAGATAPRPTPMGSPAIVPTVPPFVKHVCTPEERAKRTAVVTQANIDQAKRQKQESERLSQVIGMDPSDEASMRAYAAMVAKQAGWKSVAYRGHGIFDVDFAQSGRLDRDFVFPVLPRASVIVPFVVIRARADGSAAISAPGYRANPAQAIYGAIGRGTGDPAANRDKAGDSAAGGPNGTFIVTTDLAPLTNNTDDGPAVAGGRSRLTWIVAAGSDKVPEALLPRSR